LAWETFVIEQFVLPVGHCYFILAVNFFYYLLTMLTISVLLVIAYWVSYF